MVLMVMVMMRIERIERFRRIERIIMMVVMVVVVMIVMVLFLFELVEGFVDFLNPGGGSGSLPEVEEMSVEELAEVDIAIVAFDDLGFRLEGMYGAFDHVGIFLRNFRNLVEKHDVAELDLLDHEIFEIFLAIFPDCERFA